MTDEGSDSVPYAVAPPHKEEKQRIAALRKAEILDAKPSSEVQRLTELAQKTFRVETAVVSLIDVNRQWFLSRRGLGVTETPRDVAFCAHAINEDHILVVPDTLADPRFANNPLVTSEPHIRFYAGAIIRSSSGLPLGTLCIFDPKPRSFGIKDQNTLRATARLVQQEIVKL